MYTVFAPYSLLYPLFPFLSPPTGANPPPWAGPFPPSYSLILQKRKDKKKNKTFLLV
jgi:hypothetical protein